MVFSVQASCRVAEEIFSEDPGERTTFRLEGIVWEFEFNQSDSRFDLGPTGLK